MNRVFMGIVLSLSMGHVQADLLDKALTYVGESEREVFYGWKSHHWITKDYTNDTHHMVGVRVGTVVAGRFDNSYGRESYFLGVYGEKEYGNWEFFGVVGAMRGYKKCYGDDDSNTNTCPMIAGGVSYLGISEHFKPTVFQLGDASVIGFKGEF